MVGGQRHIPTLRLRLGRGQRSRRRGRGDRPRAHQRSLALLPGRLDPSRGPALESSTSPGLGSAAGSSWWSGDDRKGAWPASPGYGTVESCPSAVSPARPRKRSTAPTASTLPARRSDLTSRRRAAPIPFLSPHEISALVTLPWAQSSASLGEPVK